MQSIANVDLLAGIDVLCVDKTGTLSENRLTLLEPFAVSGDPEDVMLTACLTIPSDTKNLDSADRAFLRALKNYSGAKDSIGHYKVIDAEPFNPVTKRMLSLVETPPGERILCTKGAPMFVFATCLADNPDTQNFEGEYKNIWSPTLLIVAFAVSALPESAIPINGNF